MFGGNPGTSCSALPAPAPPPSAPMACRCCRWRATAARSWPNASAPTAVTGCRRLPPTPPPRSRRNRTTQFGVEHHAARAPRRLPRRRADRRARAASRHSRPVASRRSVDPSPPPGFRAIRYVPYAIESQTTAYMTTGATPSGIAATIAAVTPNTTGSDETRPTTRRALGPNNLRSVDLRRAACREWRSRTGRCPAHRSDCIAHCCHVNLPERIVDYVVGTAAPIARPRISRRHLLRNTQLDAP